MFNQITSQTSGEPYGLWGRGQVAGFRICFVLIGNQVLALGLGVRGLENAVFRSVSGFVR